MTSALLLCLALAAPVDHLRDVQEMVVTAYDAGRCCGRGMCWTACARCPPSRRNLGFSERRHERRD
jgi:hypothetical protein